MNNASETLALCCLAAPALLAPAQFGGPKVATVTAAAKPVTAGIAYGTPVHPAPHRDTVHILFSDAPINRTVADPAGLVLDYDSTGRVVAPEVTQASERMPAPNKAEFSPASPPSVSSGPEGYDHP